MLCYNFLVKNRIPGFGIVIYYEETIRQIGSYLNHSIIEKYYIPLFFYHKKLYFSNKEEILQFA
jgi:hypothetical protein